MLPFRKILYILKKKNIWNGCIILQDTILPNLNIAHISKDGIRKAVEQKAEIVNF